MIKETKFTDGDWKVQDSAPSDGYIRVTCSSNRTIAIVINSTSKYFSVDANKDIFNNSLANAHLIKTAPKLYEMLESLRENVDMSDQEYDNVTSLLAEARGE